MINDERTHLIVMGTRKNAESRKNVKVETGSVTIEPDKTERLLGIHIHESLKYQEHCRDNKKSMFNKINPRMNALKRLSKNEIDGCECDSHVRVHLHDSCMGWNRGLHN